MPNLKFHLLKLLISWNIWAMKLIYQGEGGVLSWVQDRSGYLVALRVTRLALGSNTACVISKWQLNEPRYQLAAMIFNAA